MMIKRILPGLILFLLTVNIYSQGLTCQTSEPFCTGSIYTFPAGTTGQAQPGAYYGCLNTQPAPAWYHMLVDQPGSISIYMYSTPLYDIDFICWGPFSDPYSPCVAGLTQNKVVSCSYSTAPQETCYIPNAQTGQYYILLITNYSQQPCNITFSQTGGNGTTDCTILPPPVSNNGPLCVGQTLNLQAADITGASYWWSGPNGFLSTLQNPSIPNVTLANGGDYACTITVNGQSSDPAVTTVVIHALPQATLTSNDTIVCIGSPAYLIFHFTGFGPYSIAYTDNNGPHTAYGLNAPVDTIFVNPTQATTYTINSVADNFCSKNFFGVDQYVDTYPYTTAQLSGAADICAGEQAALTFTLQGTAPWDITYTQNGSNPQTVTANSSPFILNVSPTTTTNYEMSLVEDANCSAELTGDALITVMPSPSANAGADQTVPYGTSTQLSGQATGGSGTYQFHWEPANLLVDPNIAQPTTVLLSATTTFTLTVTDDSGGCQGTSTMQVTITGGPLAINPVASPSEICFGESTQLNANAGGGSGNYTYNWTSNPAGFNSDLPEPTVIPDQTTTYNLSVNDGFSTSNSSVVVTVDQLPIANAGTDVPIPYGTTATLHGSATGGSGNYEYHWEPAVSLNNPYVANPTTHNLYQTTQFELTITDQETGCVSAKDFVTVNLTGGPLGVSLLTQKDSICEGESTILNAIGSGGNEPDYIYYWLFNNDTLKIDTAATSSMSVSPSMAGVYQYIVKIYDHFNPYYDTLNVTVMQSPEFQITGGPTIIACPYDSVTLVPDQFYSSAGYLWSNGSEAPSIKVGTTGIGFDSKSYTLSVTTAYGCEQNSVVTVVFDFSSCSGISENDPLNKIHVYPNPTSGNINIDMKDYRGEVNVGLTDMFGRNLIERKIKSSVGNDMLSLDLSSYPSGMYFLSLKGNKGRIRTEKIVLNN